MFFMLKATGVNHGRRIIASCLCFIFLSVNIIPAQAENILKLPPPGVRIGLSPEFNPAMLKGVKVFTDNPFRFDFILDQGDIKLSDQKLKDESTKLIKYFLASLTIPEKDLWVNLSPYEKDRIVPDSFGQTEMGRDLLAQDYLLKQITASLIYPEDEVGKAFWKRVYDQAAKKFGTTDIPVNTFNKVWIIPEKAVVYENADHAAAYVVESQLKVMLEEDYVAMSNQKDMAESQASVWDVALSHQKDSAESPTPVGDVAVSHQKDSAESSTPVGDVAVSNQKGQESNFQNQNEQSTNALGSQIVREIIIPELTKEVNAGKNFAKLRQIYHALILATWYKKKIKGSILAQVYSDQKKIDGVQIHDPQEIHKIYERYLKAFKEGVFNYIKEDFNAVSKEIVPRKYFSGGLDMAMTVSSYGLDAAFKTIQDPKGIPQGALPDQAVLVGVTTVPSNANSLKADMAMVSSAQLPQEPQNEIARILSQFPLTDQENAAWSQKVREVNKLYLDQMKLIAKDADDPTFYEISIREAKLFIDEFMLEFKELSAAQIQNGMTREDTLNAAFERAQHIYLDMTPPFRRTGQNDSVEAQTAKILQWIIRRQKPVLLVRPSSGFDFLKTGWEKLQDDNPNVEIHTLTGTPATDRQQMIGAQLPSKPSADGGQLLEFHLGVITRLVDAARRDSSKTFVLQIDNFEAIPAKVRTSINEFLNVGRLQIPEAPEGSQELVLPDNLKIVATITEGAVIKDSSLYDRFIRKWLPAFSDEDFLSFLNKSFSDVGSAINKSLLRTFLNAVTTRLTHGQFYILYKNLNGLLQDQEKLGSNNFINIFFRELNLIVGEPVDIDVSFDLDSKNILFNDVPFEMAGSLGEELNQLILDVSDTRNTKQKILDFIKQKTGMTVTNEILRAFAVSARALRYGNGIVRLEGPTGVGKTFFARAVSQLMDVKFYGEPIHGGSKESLWHGEWVVDENSHYYLKTDTPFMDVLKNGGVAALSELNTAVDNDYARFGWWLIPLARGETTIPLNKYPQPSDALEPFPSLERHRRSLIIIDINPSESYEARGKLPVLLQANTMSVWIEGRLEEAQIKEIAMDNLRGIADAAIKEQYAQALTKIYYALQEELRKEDRIISRDQPAVITLRDLKRAAQIIVAKNPSVFSDDIFLEAVDIGYILSFLSNNDQEAARTLSQTAAQIPVVSKPAQALKVSMLQAGHPVMLIMPSTEDPKNELDAALQDRLHEIIKVRCNSPNLDHLTLFGGYLIDVKAQKEGKRVSKIVDGIITEAIIKAGRIAREDAHKPEAQRRVVVVWLEGYYYLRSQLAVALNALLQEGTMITTDGRTLQVPENMRFFASVSAETKPLISLAEQSRWVRLHMNLVNEVQDDSSRVHTPRETQDLLRRLIMEKYIGSGNKSYPFMYNDYTLIQLKQWTAMRIQEIKNGGDLNDSDIEVIRKILPSNNLDRRHANQRIHEFIALLMDMIDAQFKASGSVSSSAQTAINTIQEFLIDIGNFKDSDTDVLVATYLAVVKEIKKRPNIYKGLINYIIEYFIFLNTAKNNLSIEYEVMIYEFLMEESGQWDEIKIRDVGVDKVVPFGTRAYESFEAYDFQSQIMSSMADQIQLKIIKLLIKSHWDDSKETKDILAQIDILEKLMSHQTVDAQALDPRILLKDFEKTLIMRFNELINLKNSINFYYEHGVSIKTRLSKIMARYLARANNTESKEKLSYITKILFQMHNFLGKKDVVIRYTYMDTLCSIYANYIEAGIEVNIKQIKRVFLELGSYSDFDSRAHLYAAATNAGLLKKPEWRRFFREVISSADLIQKIYSVENVKFDHEDARFHFDRVFKDSKFEQPNKKALKQSNVTTLFQIFAATNVGEESLTHIMAEHSDEFGMLGINLDFVSQPDRTISHELVLKLLDKIHSQLVDSSGSLSFESRLNLMADYLKICTRYFDEINSEDDSRVSQILDMFIKMMKNALPAYILNSDFVQAYRGFFEIFLQDDVRAKNFEDKIYLMTDLPMEFLIDISSIGGQWQGFLYNGQYYLFEDLFGKVVASTHLVLANSFIPRGVLPERFLQLIAKSSFDQRGFLFKYFKNPGRSQIPNFANPQEAREELHRTNPQSLRFIQILAYLDINPDKEENLDQTTKAEESEPTIQERIETLNKAYPIFDKSLKVEDDDLLVAVKELEIELKIANAWKAGKRVVILEGEPGGGKTEIAIDVAGRWGLPVEVYSAHGYSSIYDLIGGYSQDEQGRFILTAEPDSQDNYRIPFLQLLTHGGVFVIDEGAVGVKARALIGWLTGLARGEDTIVLNEHIGSPQTLRVHPEFHIIITTNPPESTAGRMDVPPEILNNAERLSVTHRFSDSSYQKILERWHKRFKSKDITEDETIKTMEQQIQRHKTMIYFVEEDLQDNPERHLISLRELRNWTIAAHSFYAKGMSWQDAVERAYELVYLKQFSPAVLEQLNQRLHPELKKTSKSVINNLGNNIEFKQTITISIPEVKWASFVPSPKDYLFSDKISFSDKLKIMAAFLILKAKFWIKGLFKLNKPEGSQAIGDTTTIQQGSAQDQEAALVQTAAIPPPGVESRESPTAISTEQPTQADHSIFPENKTQTDLKDVLDLGFHALLLLEPGVREEEMFEGFAGKNDYETVHLEATPDLMSLELLGGPFPVLPDEESLQDFRVKPGFLTRHLTRDGQPQPGSSKKLIIIHNIDALPERVRVALNNFLLKGYVDTRDDSGRSVRMTLPANVKLVATMSSASQKEFSSAFFNRFIKLYTRAADADVHGFSESLNWMIAQGLDEHSARRIQNLFNMIGNLQSSSYVWPSGNTFLLTVKDMFLHAKFVLMAIDDAKDTGTWDGNIDRVIAQEALRVYGGRLQEDPRDINAFVTGILTQVIPGAQQMLSGVITRSATGGISQLAGVPVQTKGRTEADIQSTLRLTLVPRMVNILSTILRGWQAGKMVALMGETAGAKTSMGRYLAQLMGLEHYVYSTHGQSKGRDFTVGFELTPEWKYRLIWREFLKRLAKGNQVIIIDEVNLRPEMVWILNGLARGQKTFTVEMPGEKPLEVKVGENVHFLLTMNPDRYAGRGLIPEVFEENALRSWVPTEYPDQELDLILENFLKAKQELIISWAQAQRAVKQAGFQRTKEELLDAIQKNGRHKVLKKLSAREKSELMSAILADPVVRQKMDAIRVKIGSQAKDVKVVFSWRWWAMQLDGDVRHVFVPLDELARSDRSPQAVVGLIIHELRHRRFTPSMQELKNDIIPEMPEELRPDLSPLWLKVWNPLEDGAIDHFVDPNLPGEQIFLQAMIDEFFHRPLERNMSPEEITKAAAQDPVSSFLDKLLLASYPPQPDLGIQHFPDFIQEAIRLVTDGGESSILYQATKAPGAVPDLSGRLSAAQQHQENLRAAAHRIRVMQEHIWPLVKTLIEKTPERKKSSSSQGQEQGEEQDGENEGQDEGAPTPGGLPQFEDLTDEEVSDIISQLPKAALPADSQTPSENITDQGKPTPQAVPRPMTDEERDQAVKDYEKQLEAIRQQRAQEIVLNEPLNHRLLAVSTNARRLAKKLIEIFRVPDEPYLEYAAQGFFIDAILFILRNREPFIEEVERLGKPNLAIGLTIDRSGSMNKYAEAVKQLMALFIKTFQEIDISKGQFSISYFDENYDEQKKFEAKFPAGDLNGYYGEMVTKFAKGGGTKIFEAVEGILKKHRQVTQTNKVEIVITDGQGGDSTYDALLQRFVPSPRLKAKLEQAKRMGIIIIGVGFGTKEVSVFDRYIQLDQSNALALVPILLKVAGQSSIGKFLPLGDLSQTYSSVMRRAFEARREMVPEGVTTQRVATEDNAINANADQALIVQEKSLPGDSKADVGGIDFDPDKINFIIHNKGGEIQMSIDSAMLAQLKNAPGFVPIIVDVQPVTSLQAFLGIQPLTEKEPTIASKVSLP